MAAPHQAATIGILLSTFNGAAYLPQQLESLDAQADAAGNPVDWRLYWRDDGSADDCVAIMQAYAARRDRCTHVQPGAHLGVTGSYMALLRHAVADDVQIIAFADQDDVWLPGKLARGMTHLARAEPAALYCSRQFLVDRNLVPLGLSAPVIVPPGLCPALTQNIATGCTVMLDSRAARLVAASVPPSSTLHDWWSYLVVTAAGGRLIADQEPTVHYRQHPRNAVGAPVSKRRRAMAALRRGPGAYMKLLRTHVAALRAQPALLSPEGRDAVEAIGTALDAGILPRLQVLRRFRLLRQTRTETWLFRCWFLTG